MESRSVKTKIFGTEYSLKADSGHENIIEAAAYVDKKMQEIASRIPDLPDVRVAVLTAVNLADELLRLRQKVPDDIKERADALTQLLNSALKD
jgi:cell division protein ZapA